MPSLRYSPYQTLSSSGPGLSSMQTLQSLQTLQGYQPLQYQTPACNTSAAAGATPPAVAGQYSHAPGLDLGGLTQLDWSQLGIISLQ